MGIYHVGLYMIMILMNLFTLTIWIGFYRTGRLHVVWDNGETNTLINVENKRMRKTQLYIIKAEKDKNRIIMEYFTH